MKFGRRTDEDFSTVLVFSFHAGLGDRQAAVLVLVSLDVHGGRHEALAAGDVGAVQAVAVVTVAHAAVVVQDGGGAAVQGAAVIVQVLSEPDVMTSSSPSSSSSYVCLR